MVSVIIPTYNERENIIGLVRELKDCLASPTVGDFEILVMDDDSPDGTAASVEALKDTNIRAVNRRGKPRGLSAAVIDGFALALGDILVVMDADGSHPPEKVRELVQSVRSGYNLAVASRYVSGGGTDGWPLKRIWASRLACLLARPLTPVRDATSGFFAFKRSILEGVSLKASGFKIGLEVFVRAHHENRIQEVPFIFKDRLLGASKLNSRVMGHYIKQLLGFYRHGKNA